MDLRDILKNRILIFDGAMGTMLGKYDSELYSFPELLNIQNPELVESIHRRYVQAGADVITTFTIGVNRKKVRNSPYNTEEIVSAACRNAKRAADGAYVALGIGPLSYGVSSMESSYEEMVESFQEIIAIGIREEVDALLFESFVDVLEARTAVLTAKSMTDLPVMVTFSFQKNGQTITGDTLEHAVTAVEALGLTAIGLNCTLSPSDLLSKLNRMRSLTKLPIILQPNAGPSKLSGGRRVFMNNVDGFSSALKSCVESGAAMIGGCCGTTPSYIQSIAKFKKIYSKIKHNDIQGYVSNANVVVELQRPILIGEGLSSQDSAAFALGIQNRDALSIVEVAKGLENLGCDLLNISIDQPVDSLFLRDVMHQLGYTLKTPLVLGSSDLQVLEIMVESYPGRAILNGYGLDDLDKQRQLLHLAKRFGAYVICPIKIGLSSELKKDSIQKLVDGLLYECMKAGVRDDCLIIDFMISGDPPLMKPYQLFLDAMADMKQKRNLLTFMGISSATCSAINKGPLQIALFAMALTRGLDLVLVNSRNPHFQVIQEGYNQLKGIEINSKSDDMGRGIRRKYRPALFMDPKGNHLIPEQVDNEARDNRSAESKSLQKRRRHIIYVFSDESISLEAPYVLGHNMPDELYTVYEQFEIYKAIESDTLKSLFNNDYGVFLIRVTIGALREVHSRLKSLQGQPAFYVATRKSIDLFFEQLHLQPAHAQLTELIEDIIVPQLQLNK